MYVRGPVARRERREEREKVAEDLVPVGQRETSVEDGVHSIAEQADVFSLGIDA